MANNAQTKASIGEQEGLVLDQIAAPQPARLAQQPIGRPQVEAIHPVRVVTPDVSAWSRYPPQVKPSPFQPEALSSNRNQSWCGAPCHR